MLPVLWQDVTVVNNHSFEALKPGIVKSIGNCLRLEIVEENVDFVGCECNTHVGGKGDRCGNQSNYWKYLFVETNCLFIPKRFLKDKDDLRDVFQ